MHPDPAEPAPTAHSQSPATPHPRAGFRADPGAPILPPGNFAHLVDLYRDNGRIFRELAATRAGLDAALAYLSGPHGRGPVARVHFERLRSRRSALLARLRANRIEARRLLPATAALRIHPGGRDEF